MAEQKKNDPEKEDWCIMCGADDCDDGYDHFCEECGEGGMCPGCADEHCQYEDDEDD